MDASAYTDTDTKAQMCVHAHTHSLTHKRGAVLKGKQKQTMEYVEQKEKKAAHVSLE